MITIPTNFKIRKDYERTFLLFQENFAVVIFTTCGKIRHGVCRHGEYPPKQESVAFDWMQETIERIRFENRPKRKKSK